MSHDAGGGGSPDDPLQFVALAVRSRTGDWIGVENMAGRCRSYLQGHRVHHIQIRVVYAGTPVQQVTIAGVDGDVITVEVDGETRRFRNHDPSAVQAAVARHGNVAQLRGSLLSVPAGDADYTFNLKPADEPWCECA